MPARSTITYAVVAVIALVLAWFVPPELPDGLDTLAAILFWGAFVIVVVLALYSLARRGV